ncbi:Uncharacterized protein dnm_027770 [Desulfonema magnum]|uniref:Uncharacterized protein n=1 Tax=Desulfonema magnum TaxID=45655 RepID=A0A975BJZ1_9BACT|nr:Uncharacterized protein dnm_027770 [Desulfonema magnum]
MQLRKSIFRTPERVLENLFSLSAKILFLQLRKSIFRTPERVLENLFSLSAKILFLQLRKSIFRTPERVLENLFSLKSTVLREGAGEQLKKSPGIPRVNSRRSQREISI